MYGFDKLNARKRFGEQCAGKSVEVNRNLRGGARDSVLRWMRGEQVSFGGAEIASVKMKVKTFTAFQREQRRALAKA